MCGRYVSASTPAELAADFGVDEVETDDLGPRYNVAPTLSVYAVVESRGVRRLRALRWGLVPNWAKDVSIGSKMINARAESVADNGAFRTALDRRRCLIPADGFYEWKRQGSPRQPYFLRRHDGARLALAGVWEAWKDPDSRSPSGSEDEWLRSCAIITTNANAEVSPIHERMPVVLAPSAWDAWLDRDNQDGGSMQGLLVPAPDGTFEVTRVSTEVNDVRHEGRSLVEPDRAVAGSTGEQPTLDLAGLD